MSPQKEKLVCWYRWLHDNLPDDVLPPCGKRVLFYEKYIPDRYRNNCNKYLTDWFGDINALYNEVTKHI